MVSKYNYIRLNVSTRSEWVLAIQHAENNGFPVHEDHTYKLDMYDGSCGAVNVHLNIDATGLNYKRHEHRIKSGVLDVTSIDQFKHAVNCFCHDGYLNDENLGEI